MKKILPSITLIALVTGVFASSDLLAQQNNSMIKMKGEYGVSFGVTSDDFIWKRANGDYQEKNWRYIDFNDNVNTYDPRIFDRYKLELETDTRTPLNAYTEIKIDPWTFIGIGREDTTSGNQTVTVKYKYWEATGKTINETYRMYNGDSVGYPELKVLDDRVTHHRATSSLWGSVFNFSLDRRTEIDYMYRPFRKLWVEYKEDPVYFKIFPIADQAEALTSDDPLHLSNNHVYWAPSPWLYAFDPGMKLQDAQQEALWNWDLAWYAEDSNRNFLSFLRGMTFGYHYEDLATTTVTVAAPMSLWDYYDTVNSVPVAMRFKITPPGKVTAGMTYASKFGISKKELRGNVQTVGLDINYKLWDRTDLFGEVASGYTNIAQARAERREDLGMAYKAGIKSEFDLGQSNRFKWDLSYGLMEKHFRAALGDYRDSREDRDWGRHIMFDPMSKDDMAIRIGDSLDVNRRVIGANARASLIDNMVDIYFNFRNARKAYDDKFIENITRVEATCNPTANFQLKGLALHRAYPRSLGNWDPFLKDRYTDEAYRNYHISDDQKTDLMTFSGGAKVDLFGKKLTLYGIYEATNDPQDFPRSIVNNTNYNTVVIEDDISYNRLITQVYRQDLFDLPPYGFYNIWKGVITLRPADNLAITFTHVTNGNRNYAALVDNNHNHDGIEIVYVPRKDVSLRLGYSISRIIDLNRAIDTRGGDRQFRPHHNVFAQANWNVRKDQLLTLQFGEAWIEQPEGGVFGTKWPSTRVSVLDTRPIFRAFYQGKF